MRFVANGTVAQWLPPTAAHMLPTVDLNTRGTQLSAATVYDFRKCRSVTFKLLTQNTWQVDTHTHTFRRVRSHAVVFVTGTCQIHVNM